MRKGLLDTHTVLWAVDDPSKLSSMCGPKFCSMRITEDLRKHATAMSGLVTLEAVG